MSTWNNHHKQEMELSPKQILQRLPIALAEVKAANTSEDLLNEICQIIYFLYRKKELQKKYTTILFNQYNMSTKSKNSENSKSSDPYRLVLNPREK